MTTSGARNSRSAGVGGSGSIGKFWLQFWLATVAAQRAAVLGAQLGAKAGRNAGRPKLHIVSD